MPKMKYDGIAPNDVRQYTLADLYESEYLVRNRKRSPVAKNLDNADLKDLRILLHRERKEENQMKEGSARLVEDELLPPDAPVKMIEVNEAAHNDLAAFYAATGRLVVGFLDLYKEIDQIVMKCCSDRVYKRLSRLYDKANSLIHVDGGIKTKRTAMEGLVNGS